MQRQAGATKGTATATLLYPVELGLRPARWVFVAAATAGVYPESFRAAVGRQPSYGTRMIERTFTGAAERKLPFQPIAGEPRATPTCRKSGSAG